MAIKELNTVWAGIFEGFIFSLSSWPSSAQNLASVLSTSFVRYLNFEPYRMSAVWNMALYKYLYPVDTPSQWSQVSS